MIFTRKIGKLIRGNTTPFQIYAACLLGALIGSTPGFDHAPGLILFWSFLLLILNANLFLAGVVGLLSKLVYLLSLPVAFSIGRFLLEGPAGGLFEALHNMPVIAYFGLDYYVVPGGQVLGIMMGVVCGFLASKALRQYRRKMSQREGSRKHSGLTNALIWIFAGSKSKQGYDDLLARRIGNPIRIPGVILVAVAVAGLFIASRFLTDNLVASLARSGLATANGATVDLESAQLDLKEGRLALMNVAFADPNNLSADIFRTDRIVADISGADILRKRFSIDKLVIDSASSGLTRESPGELVGPRTETSDAPKLEMPDFKDIESMVKNAEVWKERLGQLKRWMERISSVAKPEILKTPKQWDEEISNRIRAMGHANVKAIGLTQDSPLLWLKDLEALGVKVEQLGGRMVDITAENLSTQPHLVENSPSISLASRDGILNADLSLGLATGKDENLLDFFYKDLPTSMLAESIQADGKPLLEGGTIDLHITGDLNPIDSDLVAKAKFKDVTLMIAGSSTNLNGMELPIYIRGPIDSPQIKMDSDFLEDALKQAGKQKLLEKASEELGIDLGDDVSSESLEKKAGDLLGGFLKKKSEDKEKE